MINGGYHVYGLLVGSVDIFTIIYLNAKIGSLTIEKRQQN